jgi:hypothetical protein
MPFFTRYHTVKPSRFGRSCIQTYGENMREQFGMDNFNVDRQALNTFDVIEDSRAHAEDRRSLILKVDGMVGDRPSATHYTSNLLGSGRERFERVMMYAHIHLHYMPRVESGEFGIDDGIMIPSIAETDDEKLVVVEAIQFAYAFLLPVPFVQQALKAGGMERLQLVSFLPAKYVQARCKQLGLTPQE